MRRLGKTDRTSVPRTSPDAISRAEKNLKSGVTKRLSVSKSSPVEPMLFDGVGTEPMTVDSESSGATPGQSQIDIRREQKLQRRLSKLAKTLGKDFKMRLEPGSWWAYHFDSNKITYPIKDMLDNSMGANMGVICHELAHRLYSRIPAGDEVKNKPFHFLWNAIEDIRINKIIGERYAGVPSYMKELYRDFTNIKARKAQQKKWQAAGQSVPKSKQFGFAAIYEWASGGKKDPIYTDPDVVKALKEARRLPEDGV